MRIGTDAEESIMILLSVKTDGVTLNEIESNLIKEKIPESIENIIEFLENDEKVQKDVKKDGTIIFRDTVYIPKEELNQFRISKEDFIQCWKNVCKTLDLNNKSSLFYSNVISENIIDKRNTYFCYLIYYDCIEEIKNLLNLYPGYANNFLLYNNYTQKYPVDYIKSHSISVFLTNALMIERYRELQTDIYLIKKNIDILSEDINNNDTFQMYFNLITFISLIGIQLYLFITNHL